MAMRDAIRVRVTAVRASGKSLALVGLAPVQAGNLPPFTAGSHIDIDLGGGRTRHSWLCGPPADRSSYWIGVKPEPTWAAGGEFEISAPKTGFQVSDSALTHELIASGMGVTPMISMIHELRQRHDRYRLHYFARSERHVAFQDVLREDPSIVLRLGLDEAAVRSELHSLMFAVEPDACVYVCGPSGLIELVHTYASQSLKPALVRSAYFARGIGR
jgi:vanillate O-demethylase ferredoxin subunit